MNIEVEVFTDLRQARISHRMDQAVVCREREDRTAKGEGGSRFSLLEALASFIARTCLEFDKVEAVRVRIERPAALWFLRRATVEICREKQLIN